LCKGAPCGEEEADSCVPAARDEGSGVARIDQLKIDGEKNDEF
jgi:hypothetical protein